MSCKYAYALKNLASATKYAASVLLEAKSSAFSIKEFENDTT